MKTRLLLTYLLLLNICSYSQITFQKTFGGADHERGYGVEQTSDGGYIITGWVKSFGSGNYDVYLIKTDVNGDTLWTKTFGGTNSDDGYSVRQTMDGGYIITGTTYSFGAGSSDVFLTKTDANGNLIWAKTFGGSDVDGGNYVQETADSGYIIAGGTNSFGAGYYDIYLIKTDSNGDSIWTKTFGGIDGDYGYSVQQTADGGFIITGTSLSFGHDVYLIKTDTAGDTLWTKTYGGMYSYNGNSVEQTTDGGYIITGSTISVGSAAIFLLKTDANGDSLWTKAIGGTADDNGLFGQQTIDGGYIIVGYTRSFGSGDEDVYLIKTDANGDTLWTKIFGGTNDDRGYLVHQTSDGGYIITGYTYSFGAGLYDVYFIKTDSLGNSGCNEGNAVTIVNSSPTQITSPATIVTSPTTIVTTPTTIVGSGSIVTILCTTVSINEIALDNSFIIFPNPSAGNFNVSFKGLTGKGNIEILNILGEKVFVENIFNESKEEINLKNISKGIYFVKVFDGEKYYCKKIIIE